MAAADTSFRVYESHPACTVFTLPMVIKDAAKRRANNHLAKFAEVKLHEKLRRAQARLSVCLCEALTGADPSAVAMKSTNRDLLRVFRDSDSAATSLPQEGGATPTTARSGTPDFPEDAARHGTQSRVPLARPSQAEEEDEVQLTSPGGIADHDEEKDYSSPYGDDNSVDNCEDGPLDGEDAVATGRLHRLDEDIFSDEDMIDNDDHKAAQEDVTLDKSRPGTYYLHAAIKDEAIVPYLPSEDILDLVFVAASEEDAFPNAPPATTRHSLKENLFMLGLFRQRLRTPAFVAWMFKEAVGVRDVLQTLNGLQQKMHMLLAALCGTNAVRV